MNFIKGSLPWISLWRSVTLISKTVCNKTIQYYSIFRSNFLSGAESKYGWVKIRIRNNAGLCVLRGMYKSWINSLKRGPDLATREGRCSKGKEDLPSRKVSSILKFAFAWMHLFSKSHLNLLLTNIWALLHLLLFSFFFLQMFFWWWVF